MAKDTKLIRVFVDDAKRLEAIAEATGKTMAELINWLSNEALAENKKEQLDSLLQKSAQTKRAIADLFEEDDENHTTAVA